jgi:hypothetical protein
MYEPIRTKSVHTMAGAPPDFPRRSREEELEIQLAGHLSALLAITDELRLLTSAADLDAAAERLSQQVTRLRGGAAPVRRPVPQQGEHKTTVTEIGHDRRPRVAALHRRAHDIAGRGLVVAASRADTAAAILTAERMDAHAEALTRLPAPTGAEYITTA